MNEEKNYYSEGKVQITSARAIFEETTYSMSNITSVTKKKSPAKNGVETAILIVGIVLTIGGLGGLFEDGGSKWGVFIVGILLSVTGGVALGRIKPTYKVIVGSASGESDALESTDETVVDKIIVALNEAIIQRGG